MMDFRGGSPPRGLIAAKVLENLGASHSLCMSPDQTPLDAGASQRVTHLRATSDDEARAARDFEPRTNDFKVSAVPLEAAEPPPAPTHGGVNPQPETTPRPPIGEESAVMFVLRELLPKMERRPHEQLMRRPRPFDGNNPVSWINHMELFMERAGVPESDKLSIALSYLDAEALDWYVQSLNQLTRPKTWEELKAKLKRHYLAVTDEEALEELKLVKQRSTVMVYLRAFNRAASLCATLPESLKTKLFIRGLLPEIQNWVYPQHPPDMDIAITEAVRAEGELNRQKRLRGRMMGHVSPGPVRNIATRSVQEDRRGPQDRRPQAGAEWAEGRAPVPPPPPTGSRDPRTGPNRIRIPTEAECYACGQKGHFRAHCPNIDNTRGN